MKAKVTKLTSSNSDCDGAEDVDKVLRACGRKDPLFKHASTDPFANIEVKRVFTAEAMVGVKKRQADRDKEEEAKMKKAAAAATQEGGGDRALHSFFKDTPAQRKIHTPSFQTVGRNQRALLNPADRMVSEYVWTSVVLSLMKKSFCCAIYFILWCAIH
jgi:hypothetical protein